MAGLVLEESESSLAEVAGVLGDGGVVVVPSRTNYVLICDAENEGAVSRVFEAKKRTKFGPLTLAVPRIEDTERYVRFPGGFAMAELRRIWPAEVSFIFDLTYPFSPRMTMGANTVAVMYQRSCALNRLLEVFGRPVALTSANLSGQGNFVVTRQKAIDDVGGAVDAVLVNDRDDECVDVEAEGVNPSNTIVDFTFERPYLVRDGAYPPSLLLPVIPDLVLDTDAYKAALAKRLSVAL